MRFATLTLGAALPLAACATTAPPRPQSFDATLDKHVAAIQARDYNAIVDTITTGEDMVLILPGGQRLTTRDAYLKFHQGWFRDTKWVMTLEPVRRWNGSDYGYGLYRTSYDPDGAGPSPAMPGWLSLGFALENGEWRLVHDQNTAISGE